MALSPVPLLPSWFWPPGGNSARGLSLVPFGTGFAVPDWTTPTVWPYSPTTNGFTTGIVLATGLTGLAAMCPDVASGGWALGWDGSFWRLLSGGSVTASGSLPSGRVYGGCALVGSTPFFLSVSGQVYTSGGSQLGSFPPPAWFLQTSGTTLTSMLPLSGVGIMNSNTGATGRIALPVTGMVPTCMALSGSIIAMGGWRTAAPLAGGTAAALDPQDLTTLAVTSTGVLSLWRAVSAFSEVWSLNQGITGLASPISLSWAPNGTQILMASPAAGLVHVANYTAGALSFSQNLAVANASSVAFAGDSSHALVAQSGAAQLANLILSGGTWTTTTPIALTPPVTSVAALGSGQAVATIGSGLAFLTLSTGGWVVSSQVGLTFTPSLVTTDPYGMAYAAGSGQLAVVTSGGLLGYGAWAGAAPTSIAVNQGRIVLAVPSDGALYVFAQAGVASPIGTTFTQQTTGALSLGAFVGLGLSSTQLFVLGAGSTLQFGFSGLPYTLTPPRSGIVGRWNGSAWTVSQLGVGQAPSAVGFDPSGNVFVATIQNTAFTLSTGGVVLSSGAITAYSGQTQTAWFGISALQTFSSHLYGATSMPGALVELA